MGSRIGHQNRLSPWTKRLFDVLREGPRPLEDMIEDCAQHVPPGRAIRRYNKQEFKRKPESHRRIPSNDRKIKQGSRWVVQEAIRMQILRDHLAIYHNGIQEMIAITPAGYDVVLAEKSEQIVDPGWTLVQKYKTIASRTTTEARDGGRGSGDDSTAHPDRLGPGAGLARDDHDA